jgi:phosphoribosylformylglycinamidine (FGAM) synthase PurS component
VKRAYEVRLTIPDNAAFTALAALQRLGFGCDELVRAEVFLFEVDEHAVEALDRAVDTIETIFNPNKHVLRIREAAPEAGELWVAGLAPQGASRADAKHLSMESIRIAGRTLNGVRSVERVISWRLKRAGAAVEAETAESAAAALLANSAYQRTVVGS